MNLQSILRIKTITIGGSLLLALAAISGGVTTLIGLGAIQQRIDEVDQRTVPHLTQVALISRSGMDARLSMTKHILTNREASIPAADQALAERIATMDKLLADFRRSATGWPYRSACSAGARCFLAVARPGLALAVIPSSCEQVAAAESASKCAGHRPGS